MIGLAHALAACNSIMPPLAAHAPLAPVPASLQLVVNYLFPIAIILLAVAMMVSHWRSWRQASSEGDDAERSFQRRRFRRRMQTSLMLALIGVALIVGQWIPPRIWPSTYVFFWCGVAAMVFWVILLAGADFVATSTRLGRLHRQRAAEQSRLQAELIRLKRDRARQASRSEAADEAPSNDAAPDD